jgi:alpha-mannosidase
MREKNPDLWKRMAARAREGRFIPAGGTWVEPDCNVPSGESLVRQFLYGQRFFEQELGIRCREFWQPDVFGYSGQLPQIMRGAGMTRFLTQKLSWNKFNRPHHHTFTWEGIDGSQVLAHFPPADTYNSVCDVAELRRAARDYKDHDRSRHAYLLFGHGDGGGGPTPRMLELLRRARDLQGLPRTAIHSPDEFFSLLEEDCRDRPVVVGELYFEYHRGTYTSVSEVKQNNRHAELLLRDVELLAAVADRLGRAEYPQADIERLWKLVLLHQFHDILPGSSIGEVYQDARRDHAAVLAEGENLRAAALAALGTGAPAPLNTLSAARAEVVNDPAGRPVWIEAPSFGWGRTGSAPDRVTLTRTAAGAVLENSELRVTVNTDGSIASLVHRPSGREALSDRGNLLEIYDDQPVAWDAWDVDPFHLETRAEVAPAAGFTVEEDSPLACTLAFERAIGAASRGRQLVRLTAGARRLDCSIDVAWQESHRMLKVAFPIAVRAMNATYEVQFGCLERPTHYNTTYDLARYEVPAHRFADLSEHGFGVAVLAHARYGWSAHQGTLRLSLLRAPEHPAPGIDRGRHRLRWAVLPHPGSWQDAGVVAEAARFDTPVLWSAPGAAGSLFSLDDPALVLDTVKRAEDRRGLVLRLYESLGSRGTARLTTSLPHAAARRTNLLEDPGEPLAVADGAILVPYRPYEIVTIELT